MNRIFVMTSLAALLATGCGAAPASGSDTLPMKNLDNCQSLCSSIDMTLTAVVIVADRTGCVCEISGRSGAGGGASIAGGAVIQALNQEQQKKTNQQFITPIQH